LKCCKQRARFGETAAFVHSHAECLGSGNELIAIQWETSLFFGAVEGLGGEGAFETRQRELAGSLRCVDAFADLVPVSLLSDRRHAEPPSDEEFSPIHLSVFVHYLSVIEH